MPKQNYIRGWRDGETKGYSERYPRIEIAYNNSWPINEHGGRDFDALFSWVRALPEKSLVELDMEHEYSCHLPDWHSKPDYANIKMRQSIIQVCKTIRPDCQFGYGGGVIPLGSRDGGYYREPYLEGTLAYNDAVRPLALFQDVTFLLKYPHLTDWPNSKPFIDGLEAELQVADTFGKPIYLYLMFVWLDVLAQMGLQLHEYSTHQYTPEEISSLVIDGELLDQILETLDRHLLVAGIIAYDESRIHIQDVQWYFDRLDKWAK
jgi:hypothetical protein